LRGLAPRVFRLPGTGARVGRSPAANVEETEKQGTK